MKSILRRPREYILALKQAAEVSAANADPAAPKKLKQNELQIGFEGNFGANTVSPRGLLSRFLNQLVEVEGIVTKASTVKPKLVKSVQFVPKTGKFVVREHRDETALDIGIVDANGSVRMESSNALTKVDINGDEMELEQGLSTYKDYQTIILQEMPERARVGQLPRSVEVILEYDLVDKVKPGDRVQCVGVYRPLTGGMAKQGQHSGVFQSKIICNNISVIGKDVGSVVLTGTDIGNIR